MHPESVQQILDRSWIETERLERIVAAILRRIPESVEDAFGPLAFADISSLTIRAMCLNGAWQWIVFNGPGLADLPDPVVAGIVVHELGHVFNQESRPEGFQEKAAEDAMYALGFHRETIALWEAMRHLPLSEAATIENSNLHSMEAAQALREGLPRILQQFSREDGGLRASQDSVAKSLSEGTAATKESRRVRSPTTV